MLEAVGEPLDKADPHHLHDRLEHQPNLVEADPLVTIIDEGQDRRGASCENAPLGLEVDSVEVTSGMP